MRWFTNFSAFYHPSVNLNSAITFPIWPCRDKKFPPSDMEEELMMEVEACYLLKNEEEGGLPPPHFSFDYKTVAHQVLRTASSCLPACKLHKHFTLINPFLSIALLLAKLFLHWKIKSSSEASSPPLPTHFCGFTLGNSEFSRSASKNTGQERGGVGQGYGSPKAPF